MRRLFTLLVAMAGLMLAGGGRADVPEQNACTLIAKEDVAAIVECRRSLIRLSSGALFTTLRSADPRSSTSGMSARRGGRGFQELGRFGVFVLFRRWARGDRGFLR
jgi:hypothetical protein